MAPFPLAGLPPRVPRPPRPPLLRVPLDAARGPGSSLVDPVRGGGGWAAHIDALTPATGGDGTAAEAIDVYGLGGTGILGSCIDLIMTGVRRGGKRGARDTYERALRAFGKRNLEYSYNIFEEKRCS